MMVLIFDLGQVLFDWDQTLLRRALTGEKLNPYKALDPGITLLRKYNQRGVCCFVISNWHEDTLQLLWEYYSDVLNLFNDIIVPSKAGYSKPDQRIFTYFLAQHDVLPEECIFIDDMAENIATAQILGMHGILYDKLDKVAQQLQALFVEK
jgi:2-haloacid dehalogenase